MAERNNNFLKGIKVDDQQLSAGDVISQDILPGIAIYTRLPHGNKQPCTN